MNRLSVSLLLAAVVCVLTLQTAEADQKPQKSHARRATPSCGIAMRSESRLAAVGQTSLQSMKTVQSRVYARGVKDQLDATFMHARLQKQIKLGINVTPEQNRLLVEADKRATQAFKPTSEELRLMAEANTALEKVDADFSAKYGKTWSNCNCHSSRGSEECLVQLDELQAQARTAPTEFAAN